MSNKDSRGHPIAVFLPSLGGGGAERAIVLLANGFAASGQEVHLVLGQAVGPYLSEISPAVHVVDLKKKRVLYALPALVRYMWQKKPRAILSAMNYANIIAIIAKTLGPKSMRIVVSERSSPSGYNSVKFRYILLPLMRLLYPRADRIICVSQGVADDLQTLIRVPDSQVDVFPNPLDMSALKSAANQPISHKWLNDPNKKLILAVGRLSVEKDYETLLSALALVRQKSNAYLVILGEGNCRGALETLIAELGLQNHVEMLGFQPNPFPWMAKCDVYVLSSATEGFPNSLVQAMACGAKVVSTDCKHGPKEILDNGRYGTLVPVGNDRELANAIVEALGNGAPANVQEAAERYSPEKIIEQYLRALG